MAGVYTVDTSTQEGRDAIRAFFKRMAMPKVGSAAHRVWLIREHRIAELKACSTAAEMRALRERYRAEDDAQKVRLSGEDFIRYLGKTYPLSWPAYRVEAALTMALAQAQGVSA